MRFALIDARNTEMPAQTACAVLGVSASGYYAWKSREASPRQRRDMVLLAHIRSQFSTSNETYGSPRMHVELNEEGLAVGRHRVARIMRDNDLKARQKTRFKKTTDSDHGGPVAINVLGQNFTADGPNEKWGVDISYVWTAEGGTRQGTRDRTLPSQAASLTLVGGTVWEAFATRAQLRAGETILIHGGAGGVGTIAIQVAKAMGAQVFTTASRKNRDFVKELGAEFAIDYQTDDYVEVINDLTGGAGVDVVFDTIGGDTLTKSPLVLAQMGRVVTLVDIAKPQNLIEAWGRNASYHFLFTRQNRGKLDALTRLVERGLVRPVIGATFPLARIGEAHAHLEAGSANGLRGKVVVNV